MYDTYAKQCYITLENDELYQCYINHYINFGI